jgi:hypothetical protein
VASPSLPAIGVSTEVRAGRAVLIDVVIDGTDALSRVEPATS